MAANGEESEVKLREMDEEALDNPKLVSSVASMLKSIGGSPAEDELDADPTHEDDDVIEQDDDDVEDTDEAEADEGDQPTPEDEDEGKVKDDTKVIDLPEIPDAYYRSAARYGWNPEAVKDMVEKIGLDNTVTMLQNLHQKDNNMTNVFSQLGRKAKELEAGPPTPPSVISTPSSDSKGSSFDMEALKDKYGEDDPLVMLFAQQAQELAAMKESFQELNTNLTLTQTEVQRQEQELEEQTRKSVNGFFDGKDMEPFSKFYGKLKNATDTWKGNLSVQQATNRDLVCQYADQILIGAKMHGDPMSLAEAMERAHMIVSEPIAETIVRNQIMTQVEKRSKSRVVRPSEGKSRSKKTTRDGKPSSQQELVDRTNERLSSLFKGLRN